ncbi:MAG TPA: PTS sugar transporter subunit IIA, partial [Bacillota bacterium]|nr:PTS sugar transporter subunit IIA [Bacillota bacterium]
MTTLASYTSPELIFPQLLNRATPAVIGELCSALERHGRVKEPLPLFNAVMSHEMLSSSAMAPGWALPHARLKQLSQLSFALGRSRPALEWHGQAEPKVQLVFLSAIPETDGATYLTLISGLARLSQDAARLERLLQASNREAIYEV